MSSSSGSSRTTATLVIDFSSVPEGEILQAELDEERNGGRSSFAPGDTVFFRVWASIPYTVEATAGSVTRVEQGASEEAEEVLSFPYTDEASVQHPVASLGDTTWYGTSLGTLSAAGGTSVRAAQGGAEKIGICKCRYTHQFDVWQLQSPSIPAGMDEYHVLVVVAGAPSGG